ncbi:hypothetical protein [Enorma phocaeensis]|uniref:hypothetical protein n=1 Tax=Enorma phocaeensis TaxID=1871019 RepID=UPI002352AF92|nr:hypothetical protein [Enorma phocaeensis]
MEFTKVTTDPVFSISGVVLGGCMAVVSFRWVNAGLFQSEAWSSGVQLAKMVGWNCPREHQALTTDNLIYPAGAYACACVVGQNISWRTNVDITVPASSWHEGQLLFPVTRAS